MFGRPTRQNQSFKHPFAAVYMSFEPASLSIYHFAKTYDTSARAPPITQYAVRVASNRTKYVAAEAAFTACEVSISTGARFIE